MRTLAVGLFVAVGMWAQAFSFGVKGGAPLTDLNNTVSMPQPVGNPLFTTNPYIIGPTAEIRLPFGLGVEFDALYRHFNDSAYTPGVFHRLSSGDWEFPLLAKYHLQVPIVKPYVDAGVAWDRLSGLTQTTTVIGPIPLEAAVQPGFVVASDTVAGFVVGGASISTHWSCISHRSFVTPVGARSISQTRYSASCRATKTRWSFWSESRFEPKRPDCSLD